MAFQFNEVFESMMQSHNLSTVVILAHMNPDGDAAGSVMGLAHYINDVYPQYKALPYLASTLDKGPKKLVADDALFDPYTFPEAEQYGVIVCDTATKERMIGCELYERAAFSIVIDHHASNEGYDDIHPISGFLRDCEDIEVGFTMHEEIQGTWRCSFRSDGLWINVNELLNPFGGGGHAAAAGLRKQTDDPGQLLDDVLQRIMVMTDTTISHHGRTNGGKSLSPRRFAVVFDMDGVILDTERIVIECWQDIAEKYRIPDIETACIASLGLTAEATIRTFKKIYGDDFPYEQYKAEMRELFFGKHYGEHLPLKPGAEDILKRLKEKGIPIALASSTREAVVRKELGDAGVLQYFDKLICGDMVMHSKPHPEIFLTACKELGVNPADAYAIEDSFNGIRSAYAGGLRTIMVPDQVQPDEEIRALSTKVCQSLYEAADYLLQNSGFFLDMSNTFLDIN